MPEWEEKWVKVKNIEEFKNKGGHIRTKQIKEGMWQLWNYNDVAHVWIDGEFYRITKKGTVLKRVTE